MLGKSSFCCTGRFCGFRFRKFTGVLRSISIKKDIRVSPSFSLHRELKLSQNPFRSSDSHGHILPPLIFPWLSGVQPHLLLLCVPFQETGRMLSQQAGQSLLSHGVASGQKIQHEGLGFTCLFPDSFFLEICRAHWLILPFPNGTLSEKCYHVDQGQASATG